MRRLSTTVSREPFRVIELRIILDDYVRLCGFLRCTKLLVVSWHQPMPYFAGSSGVIVVKHVHVWMKTVS